MSYRFFNPAPVFMDLLGLQPLAGGSLAFYDLGTTAPKLTWSDPDLAIPNENPVPLDSSGRANVNIFLDGGYSVRLLDAQGATVWTRDVNDGSDGSASIPSPLMSGQFLTNDGSNLLWDAIRQPPDPAGSSGYILSTDGSNLIWIPQPEPPEPPDLPVENFDNRVIIGSLMMQWGTGQAPATGERQSGVAISFPTAFGGVPYHVDVTVSTVTLVSAGLLAVDAVPTKSASGFSAQFDSNERDNAARFTNPIPFTWFAVGPKP